MHKCRDCMSLLQEPQAVLCPRCRTASEEKRKARKRDRSQMQYRLTRRPKAPDKAKPPHRCLTEGCRYILEGKALYCPACRRARHLTQQQHYRNHLKALDAGLPPEPVTNLDWLKNFSDWAKSGLNYAAYQKAEWENTNK